MIEIALDRTAHHRLVASTTFRGISSFTKIRKVRDQKNTERIRIIENKRIVDFDMDAKHIKAGFLGLDDVILNRAHIAGRINSFRMVGLIKRTAQIDGGAIQSQNGRCVRPFHRLRGEAAHAKVTVDYVWLRTVSQSENDSVKLRRIGIPQNG